MSEELQYPTWVCLDCGKRYGRRVPTMATWHDGDKCGVCDEVKPTTEPRDFGHLHADWRHDSKLLKVRAQPVKTQE